MINNTPNTYTIPNSVNSPSSNSLVIVDSNVSNYASLANIVSPSTEVIMLDSGHDAIEQISEILAQYSNNLSALHLVSHGQLGALQLGNVQLDFGNLNNFRDELTSWQGAFTNSADLLLYGCNIAGTSDGQAFVQELSNLTGADVGASKDLTGDPLLGGDSDLEFSEGVIETNPLQMDGVEILEGMMHNHQQQLLDLVPSENATHVAVKSGSWFDPKVWNNGVPDNGANVLIPDGFRVFLARESDARLMSLRVDGTLKFAHGQNTKLLVDTFAVLPTGKLIIGTANRPIQANKTARIIFTSDRGKLDNKQLGRGLISAGSAKIYGAQKLDFVALTGDAVAGDSELVLDLPAGMGTPAGWQVGDQLVLGGTEQRYGGSRSHEDNTIFHDEELTITAIEGNRIRFTNNDISSENNSVLRFDHERPEGFEEYDLKLYVANTTRNVVFETEEEGAPTQERGHVMFMHNPDVEVHNAGFYNLGRSDKTKLVDDPQRNVDGSRGFGKNPRGRYSLHFHRTGANDINSTPSSGTGNAVVDSPGWGIVHHDSHAVLEDNVVFDVAGTGIAAESGNEIGAWRNNLTIKTTGNGERGFNPVNKSRNELFDLGFKGEGYWVQGAAQVEMENNIAISAAGGALSVFAAGSFSENTFRDVPTFPVANLTPEQQVLASRGESEVDVTNLPLRRLSGFESYNTAAGMIFWHHMANEDGQLEFNTPGPMPAHSLRSLVEDFRLWNVSSQGIRLHYTSQVDFVDGVILGKQSGIGIRPNDASQNLSYTNLHVAGFNEGLQISREGDEEQRVPFLGSRLQDSSFANNTYHLSRTGGMEDTVEYFEIVNTTFDTVANNATPVAQFSHEAAGGLGWHFDGSQSSDSDAPAKMLQIDNAIVSYGWDWDSDGTIDHYGRQVSHVFEQEGPHQVSLTVWDTQGATDTITQTVKVTSTAYENLLDNGDFSAAVPFGGKAYRFDSKRAGEGWIASRWSRNSNLGDGGAAVVSGSVAQGIGQVILDQGLRRGEQTLSLDLKNTEGNNASNEITVHVWGINGQFSAGNIIRNSGPQAVGALPMNQVKLLEESIGGSTFDWQTFEWDLDFDNGYQFVMVQVSTKKVNTSEGDFVAIDNLSLTGGNIASSSSNTPPGALDNPATGIIRIEAEDYVAGGQNVSYFDATPNNLGGAYRNDEVDIQATSDIGGGFNVGWISSGEWLTYNDINVSKDRSYKLVARVATPKTGMRSLSVTIGDTIIPVEFGNTGGWQSWQDVVVEGVNLTAGTHTVRVDMLSSHFNLNYLELIPTN